MMRTLRLAILGASLCGQCAARCCKQNGHTYAVLLEGDERRKFAPFATDARIGGAGGAVAVERVLPYRDGRCVFLADDDRCAIYEDRPVNCRRFECVGGYHRNASGFDPGAHSEFLRRNPDVLELLERL